MGFYNFCTETISPGTSLFVGRRLCPCSGWTCIPRDRLWPLSGSCCSALSRPSVNSLFCIHKLDPSRLCYPIYRSSLGFCHGMELCPFVARYSPTGIVAASITISYWQGARDVNPAAWVTLFLFLIISIDLFGVRGYGEAEFVLSIIKVAAVSGFIILGIVIDTGDGPNHHYN